MASRCFLCNQDEDGIDHVFIHYPYSTYIWERFCACFGISWPMHQSIEGLIKWWKSKARILNLKNPWLLSFSIVATNIWWERNRRSHEDKARSDAHIFEFICHELGLCLGSSKGEVKSISNLSCCRKLGLHIEAPKCIPPLEVHWCKPHLNWFKINVDGSSLGNPGRVGAGGIARNKKGQICKSFSIYLGIKKIFEAEFEAVLEGLIMAKRYGAREVWVESDSAGVVSAVQKNQVLWFVLQRWRAILPYLNSISWKISHCFREANVVADYLARKASKSGITETSVTFPSYIMMEIENDAMDMHRFRLC
ncbi:uncharacterized protein LOC122073748 [Macadamia integrifolia]|uniref:uncharacterized protein LOC122073748 n=1 Tax=Macadamia integrifolia TaxID=60698 RepID=UPI001C4F907F|nr:uncharacterized protein LOC122073748 [Macadamia integrifolia]